MKSVISSLNRQGKFIHRGAFKIWHSNYFSNNQIVECVSSMIEILKPSPNAQFHTITQSQGQENGSTNQPCKLEVGCLCAKSNGSPFSPQHLTRTSREWSQKNLQPEVNTVE